MQLLRWGWMVGCAEAMEMSYRALDPESARTGKKGSASTWLSSCRAHQLRFQRPQVRSAMVAACTKCLSPLCVLFQGERN